MSVHSMFIFLAQYSLELTIAVISITCAFVILRAKIISVTNHHKSPTSLKSFDFSSHKPIESYSANLTNQIANPIENPIENQIANQANHIEKLEDVKPIKSTQCIVKQNENNDIEKPIKQDFQCSKVFWSNEKKVNPKPINKNGKQIDKNKYYSEYLDGYCSLTENQKIFLGYIKNNNLTKIQHMISINKCNEIINNINFGEYQILRECILSERLNILKYLKKEFINELSLNGESGYCLRWSSRKGLFDIVNYLLYEQKYEQIDISYFQFQAIEWSIVYGHKKIAQLLQKFYKDWKLNTKWNVLSQSQLNISFEFDIFNLPSIYQQIIEIIINNNNIQIIKKYYRNGCDLCFENNMPWKVASDCTNIQMLQFLHETVGVNPVCCGNYLLITSLENNSIQLLKFAKKIINDESWKQSIEPNIYQLKILCKNNKELLNELEEYNILSTPTNKKSIKLPQTPMPWPYENVREKYGILTRSKRKLLVKKGILQEINI